MLDFPPLLQQMPVCIECCKVTCPVLEYSQWEPRLTDHDYFFAGPNARFEPCGDVISQQFCENAPR